MKLVIADAGPVSPLPILRPPAVPITDFGHRPRCSPMAPATPTGATPSSARCPRSRWRTST
ncbi:hypothetical protein [Nonomuraea dietziae]|uniref:hypothetical protein n=1 Tax=Nonomuraea dietziae TaxID=65515 RepID=UPI0031DD53A0